MLVFNSSLFNLVGSYRLNLVLVICVAVGPRTRDSYCTSRLLYDQLMMTSQHSLLGIQATAHRPPLLGGLPLQSPTSLSRPSTSSSELLSSLENCCPWIQLYHAGCDLRNSVVDPRRLLLRLDTLPPQSSDELDKVCVHFFKDLKDAGKILLYTKEMDDTSLLKFNQIPTKQ